MGPRGHAMDLVPEKVDGYRDRADLPRFGGAVATAGLRCARAPGSGAAWSVRAKVPLPGRSLRCLGLAPERPGERSRLLVDARLPEPGGRLGSRRRCVVCP